jgi:hypothetical protein
VVQELKKRLKSAVVRSLSWMDATALHSGQNSTDIRYSIKKENIQWFIEGQDMAPSSHPIPFPYLPSASCFYFSSSCVSLVELTDEREWGRERGRSQAYNNEKAWSTINHSILSACQ